MLEIKENLAARRKLLEALKSRFFRRRPGWHVSELICCPRRTYFRRIGDTELFQDGSVLFFTAGKAHHNILEYLPLKEIPKERDSVHGTIDMIGDRITEIFTTRLSSKRKPEELTIKIKQLKSYLYMGEELEGDLMVLYLMGDYVDRAPDIKVYTARFLQEELESHWAGLIERRVILEGCIRDKRMPEEIGEIWECKRCGYMHRCRTAGALDMLKREQEKLMKEVEVLRKG